MNNEPAFPIPDSGDKWMPQGMSLRDYFAAKALVYPEVYKKASTGTGYWAERVAYHAYQIADAMLAEREEEPK